ncbi:hypothetical protein PR048_000397 [Dryococelus australis]|uniref:Golgi resident protein GCP60 n=1 Tax=Dryococelus australis TaxID=614101 RepID=A0ABQ9IF11_9NEOP|nr:hypothetical protein PR048_000397 [Dryococelus australis]
MLDYLCTICAEEIHHYSSPLQVLNIILSILFAEKEGKAVHLSYEDKLKLVAFTRQISHGMFNVDNVPPLGVLDVIGRDRRLAWQALGDISRQDAMVGFVELLDKTCPIFRPYVEAHKRDEEERERLAQEELERQKEEEERIRLEEEAERKEEQDRAKQEVQRQLPRRQIQDALNQQTYHQFKAYAEQQYPGNPEQQGVLIRQLQEQHYHQYMQQLYQQQCRQHGPVAELDLGEQAKLLPNGESFSLIKSLPLSVENYELAYETQIERYQDVQTIATMHWDNITQLPKLIVSAPEKLHNMVDVIKENLGALKILKFPGVTCGTGEFPAISAASMWTRKDIKEFKESIRKEGGDAVIKVGHGETVTVRVPTHEDGTCLFWEFATDNYDIGFGVYFEWSKSPTNQVSVHISESEDEEDVEDEEDEGAPPARRSCHQGRMWSEGVPWRGSQGSAGHRSLSLCRLYRRDCQEEVYAGSHLYPGQGIYLLKFDNSYSLWRSKTLYYRVYYTR